RVSSPARLRQDGSIDATFKPGIVGEVGTMEVQNDGKILIAGPSLFQNVWRLQDSGAIDESFNNRPGANESIQVLALHEDGRILVGGTFTSFAGEERHGLLRLLGGEALSVEPEFTMHPLSRSVMELKPFALAAEVDSWPPPLLQWQLNGTNIPGA